MDLTQLRAFVTVARQGNLTRAAQLLHVTQPAISQQLKALQAGLGVQLLLRSPQGMVLTRDGAKLLPLAEKVLANVSELSQAASALQSTLTGTLALGTILDPEFTRLGAFLKRLVETYPQLAARLRQGTSGGIREQVRNGELDVGYYLGNPGREFHYEILTPFTYLVVAPPGWKNRVGGQDWQTLARLPWIGTPPDSVHHRLLTPVFAQYQIAPNIVAEVDQEASMLDLVKSGVGLSLIRESIALREAHAHGLAIADAVQLRTDLSFITLAKRKNEPLIKSTFELLRDVWQS
jgi:DNA-binding transcriptional LysR family regulator